jgi:16S rRNA processing protein RimM
MNKSDALKLGKIIKVHGKDGEMICTFDLDRAERLAGLKFIFIEIDRRLIPFLIESIQLDGNHARIKLEDIDNPEEAQAFIRLELYLPYADMPGLSEKEFHPHEIIGFSVVDKSKGEIGRVNDVLARPGQSLLQVIAHNKELLIPLAEELIIEVDKEKQLLVIDAPEGLIDLYLD